MGAGNTGRPRLIADVAVVGAGAAGLAAAIFLRRFTPSLHVLLVEGARRPGAKILVSGGSRCNVTNAVVTERDFWGGNPAVIRRVLRGFPVPATIAFFKEIGVALHVEEHGKLFPDSNRARDVLDALLGESARLGVRLLAGSRVTAIERSGASFLIHGAAGPIVAPVVILATGGQSLPKSGSDGAGFEFARALGHTIVPTTPALVPLVLSDAAGAVHRRLSGVAHDAEVSVRVGGSIAIRQQGALLWTHFGISGPVVLDASRHWLRERLEGREVALSISLAPGDSFDQVDAWARAVAADRPRATLQTVLATRWPGSVAEVVVSRAELDASRVMAHLTREERRRLTHALTDWVLDVVDSRGYTTAEATAGGVPLDEIDAATLQSRRCPGLYFAGEILDVDGRIGGFNFQWAWSSARVAARAIARRSATGRDMQGPPD